MIDVNNHNSVVLINTIGEALTGWQQKEASGKNLTEVFHLLNQETLRLIAGSIKAPQSDTVISLPEDTILLTKTGKLTHITGSVAAIRDNQENIVGAILIFRTVEKPKQTQAVMPSQTSTTNRTSIDDISLIETFIQNFIQEQEIHLHNPNLKTEYVGDTIQLLGKTEGLVAKAMFAEKPPSLLGKKSSRYWELLHQALFANSYYPIGQIQNGVYRYQHRPMPENYQMHCTDALDLWQVWLAEENRNQRPGLPMDIIVLRQGTWYPVLEMNYRCGKILYVKTIDDQVAIDGTEMLIWGKKVEM